MRGDLPYLDRPRLCVVPGLTAYAWYPALHRQAPLMCSARGALLCLRAVLCFASTGPGVLRQAPLTSHVRCGALLTSTAPALPHFDTPRGCFARPYFLRALLALLCFACFAYVFSTHTEGGDPGSLHEKKIKTKEF